MKRFNARRGMNIINNEIMCQDENGVFVLCKDAMLEIDRLKEQLWIWKNRAIMLDEKASKGENIGTLMWETIPEYGDLFTKEEFIESVNTNCLIDYDGWGNYSNGKEMSNIEVYPSLFKRYGWDGRFTHVVWFNR